MAADAPGLRAIPSAAAATALACASPHMPEAIAMEKPAVIATQCPLAVWLPGVWPNSGHAIISTAIRNSIFHIIFFVIRTLLRNRPQEVVPVILVQPGSRWKGGIMPVLGRRPLVEQASWPVILVRRRSILFFRLAATGRRSPAPSPCRAVPFPLHPVRSRARSLHPSGRGPDQQSRRPARFVLRPAAPQ